MMKRSISLLVCMGCIFALSQCDMDDNGNSSWDDSVLSVAFLARITDNSGEWSLCAVDASGNNMQKIVDKSPTCQKPVCSHSGKQLLFSTLTTDSKYELYSVNINGTNLTLIDHANRYCGSADWSPDDTRIVYIKSLDDNSDKKDLIVYNILDKTHTILHAEGDKSCPKFSPDGTQIAYCASIEADYYSHHIYKINAAGGESQLILKDASCPVWSPQGDKIAYLAAEKGGSTQIFVADAYGHNSRQLTSTVSPRTWPGWPPNGNNDPQWTPDGKKIVYVSWENERPEIFIMNADGSNQTRLTQAELRDECPEITPNGKYILYASRKSNVDGICIMTLNGSNQRVLSNVGHFPVACK